jgi:DNA-binding transcriptional regulator YiaG
MYHYTDGGLRNVWLKNGYVEKDTPYGKAVSFHDLDGLTKAICMALSNKPGKLTGAEFRYIRSGLFLSQKSLGKLLGCTEQAIAKWEKTGKVPKPLTSWMIYKQAHDGKEGVGATVKCHD